MNGLVITCVVLVDFMRQPGGSHQDKSRNSFESKTVPGRFLGYYQKPGGMWNGRYRCADTNYSISNINTAPQQVEIHRIKEVVIALGEDLVFPVARRRKLGWQTLDANVVTLGKAECPIAADDHVQVITGSAPLPHGQDEVDRNVSSIPEQPPVE